jgi:hypothetical protein
MLYSPKQLTLDFHQITFQMEHVLFGGNAFAKQKQKVTLGI